MAEVLEGVLSETMLDQLALDLGVEARVLRQHPFFRVLKGRVLLTYPLRVTGRRLYEQQARAWLNQVSPVTDDWYEVMDEEDVRLKFISVTHNQGEARLLDVKIVADGVTIETTTPVDVATDEAWFAHRLVTYNGVQYLTLTATPYLVDLYEGMEAQTVVISIRTTEAMTAGKTLQSTIAWEKIAD